MDTVSFFDLNVVLVFLVIGVVVSLLLPKGISFSSQLPLPPGPIPLPVIGNALQLPRKDSELKYRQWHERYGDIVHLTVVRQHIVILNSAKVAFELLDKRGRIYSSRPASVMVKMVGLDDTWTLLPYGETLRHFRKLGHYVLSSQAIKNYELIHEEEARRFTQAILGLSDNLLHHIDRFSSVVLLRLLYGYSPSPELDNINTAAQRLVTETQACLANNSRILDVLPFLRHIPTWFPFISFQQKAEEIKALYRYVFNVPFNMVKQGLESNKQGIHSPGSSLCATLLNDDMINGRPLSTKGEREAIIKQFLGSTYPPGQETTAASLHAFFMLMATHQDIQAKARAEILSVVGEYRLPNISDTKSLVYLTAVMNELLRFQSVAPLAVPRLLEEDDTYDGYRIPKGTIVLANIWEILHDENVYPDPFSFKPERFLGSHEKTKLRSGFPYNPSAYVFGFGRRSCPGMHFAEASLMIIMATVLATCEITPCRGEDGVEIPIDIKFKPNIVLHPVPFQCSIKPYSRNAASLLHHATDGLRGSPGH